MNAVNTVGGILLMWDKRVLDKIDSHIGSFSVSCNWKRVVDGFDWTCTGVYGPTVEASRGAFWDDLETIRQIWNHPWCVMGDFNVVHFSSEHLGCNSFSPSMLDFSDFIESSYLVDLPLEGGLYTWGNGSDPPFMSCTDHVLVSPDWEEQFPDDVEVTSTPNFGSSSYPGGSWRYVKG